jgi:hypothetical protein
MLDRPQTWVVILVLAGLIAHTLRDPRPGLRAIIAPVAFTAALVVYIVDVA